MKKYNLIDLGLPSGTLWMDRNIEAKSPSDSGLYFAWGETTGYTRDEARKLVKTVCSNGCRNKLTKYCNVSAYGLNGRTDSLVTLQTADDAVYAATNGECCMPTKEQFNELIDNTIYSMAVKNDVFGSSFTSKTNDNYIFIPDAGYCIDGFVKNVGKFGYLWSSSLYEDNPCDAYYYYLGFDLDFNDEEEFCHNGGRCYAFPVRGVKSK